VPAFDARAVRDLFALSAVQVLALRRALFDVVVAVDAA